MLFAPVIHLTCLRYDISTPERIAAFIAQIAHESARFGRLVENLNYSASGLALTWPSRFRTPGGKPNALALRLHRNPEAIANNVYANRLGNGSENSGDGWKYRGRGLIQITGRSNHRECGAGLAGLSVDLEVKPELLEYPIYAALSAGWYWHTRGLNAHADGGDIERISRIINGGTNGLQDRIELTARAMQVLTE